MKEFTIKNIIESLGKVNVGSREMSQCRKDESILVKVERLLIKPCW